MEVLLPTTTTTPASLHAINSLARAFLLNITRTLHTTCHARRYFILCLWSFPAFTFACLLCGCLRVPYHVAVLYVIPHHLHISPALWTLICCCVLLTPLRSDFIIVPFYVVGWLLHFHHHTTRSSTVLYLRWIGWLRCKWSPCLVIVILVPFPPAQAENDLWKRHACLLFCHAVCLYMPPPSVAFPTAHHQTGGTEQARQAII